ncbi:MAG: thioether cross-link-forming SCIFF peptide maturase [Clostridiales bacterium]|jgi:uncharacterized protein|nr:thioether cross-link-forming SCIFF peptide maturase [Clostridiales bacterium]
MVHTFECLGSAFALDTESGSFFQIDSAVKEIIDEINSPVVLSRGEFACLTADANGGDGENRPTGDGRKAADANGGKVLERGTLPPSPCVAGVDGRGRESFCADASERAEAKREVDALIERGVLFSPRVDPAVSKFSGVVKALCLNISHLCNLRCAYCFADGGAYRGKEANMPLKTACAAVDFLIERSGTRRHLEIDFFGGEPLLNRQVMKDAVRYIRRREAETGKVFQLTVTTNAMGLDEDAVDFFNREMYNVVVSIDGRESVHNTVRKTVSGGGSFDVALKNALRFKEKRVGLYYIRGTYTARNTDFSKDVFYLNDLGFDSLSIEPVVLPADRELALKEAHLPALFAEYETLAAGYLERRQKNPAFTFFHFMLDIYNPPCREKLTKGCGAGCEYLAVAPDGSLYPCHQFDGEAAYRVGNVLDGSFSEEIPRLFSGVNVLTKAACAGCWAKYYCSGGCNANAALIGGNILRPDPVSCALMRKRIECALAVSAIENANT